MSLKYTVTVVKTLFFHSRPKAINRNSVKISDTKEIKALVIPNSVATIGKYAFQNFSSLASIHIPNSISTIGDSVFLDCHELASAHTPNSINLISPQAFFACRSLTSIHIPNSVSTISVPTIETHAFNNCPRLHKACVPANAKIKISWTCSLPFASQIALLRPRIKPITFLQKKSACRASKATYSISL